jgi:hypothetical protein
MPILSREAFLPRHLRERHSERREWLANRDQLFAAATPREQEVLVAMAEWESNCRYGLIARPNLFSESKQYLGEYKMALVFYTISGRELPPKPNAVIRSLARIDRGLASLEARLARVQRRRFLAHLLRQVHASEEADVLMGVCFLLSAMRLEPDGQLTESLSAQINESFTQKGTPAARRLDRVLSLSDIKVDRDWRSRGVLTALLLEVAEQDLAAALRYLDEDALRLKDRRFDSFLEGHPEVLTRLALLLQFARPALAQKFLVRAVGFADHEFSKCLPDVLPQLRKVMDASCETLAQWVLERPQADEELEADSLYCLLRYGDPCQAYWSICLDRAWERCQQKMLEPVVHFQWHHRLIEVAFYSPPGSIIQAQALERFDTLVRERLSRYQYFSGDFYYRTHMSGLGDMKLLESAPYSGRNRRFQAAPNHPLNQVLRRNFQQALQDREQAHSVDELGLLVDFAIDLQNEAFAAECLEQISIRFESFARRFPKEAGQCLRDIGRCTKYHSTRAEKCAETFEKQLPLLDEISVEDAAVARTASNWSPRGVT